MTVSISKPNWRGLQALRARAASARRVVSTTEPQAQRARWRGEVDSTWVLTAMMGALCLLAVGWFFAHGAAATFWLIALVTIGFAGVPLGLLALRLLRYDDSD